MPTAVELLRQGRKEELWQMCCGFINLTLEQFMTIQKRLLLEQIELLNRCALGNKIMRGTKPESIEEFREKVLLTTCADYCPELIEKREDILPAKPALWVHTSGRSSPSFVGRVVGFKPLSPCLKLTAFSFPDVSTFACTISMII